MGERVMKPWTAVKLCEENESVSVGVWGRENKSGRTSFLESMTSQNSELLDAPVRIVGREDGRDFVFSDYNVFSMERTSDAFAEVLCSAESEQFLINVAMKTEFDGFIDTSLTIAPRGRTVQQIFGSEGLKSFEYVLDRLWIEIPLKRECAKYFQMFPRPDNMGVLEASGEIKNEIQMSFKAQILLANDNVGFMVSFESREGFVPFDSEQCFEIIPDKEKVILRIRLIDEEPYYWMGLDKRDPKERMSLHPRTFHFGIITTPVKPMSKQLTEEKAVHIDCYKKIAGNYEDFLRSEFEDTGEITFDRLKRLGVNTLYLHEKWNDLQNSPILTTQTASRLRYIIDECHKRAIRVIPYFGYEISSLAPYFREFLPDAEVQNTRISRWYRKPAQRDSKVCQKSRWSEFFTSGIEKLVEQYGFDGIYLDGTAYLWACMNTAHGCGCYCQDGTIYPSYPVFATRETLKQLYRIICEKHGGIINCHAGSAFNMPALSFASSLWDGEVFQSVFINGTISKLPDEYFQCLYTGKNLGLPIYMLCYLNPPVWSFDMALAVSLPFGILPKVNDAGEPLEKISEIWKIYESFGVDSAEFIPFYSQKEKGISVSDDRVKVSVYKKEHKILAIISITDKNLELEFALKSCHCVLENALTGDILSRNGDVTLKLSGFDYLILEMK